MSSHSNPVIHEFIAQYKKDQESYEQLCGAALKRIKGLLEQKGIMALVTARVKDAERLEQKLLQRDAERPEKGKAPYRSREDIFADIPDLVGARIALYFPGDAARIEDLLSPQFVSVTPKAFPEKVDQFDELVQSGFTAYKRKIYHGYDNRRFDGYCALHFRVRFAEQPVDALPPITIEIQVASVLMHAWSEVEHDLAYKKMMGNVTREEYECLDEINGLVMAGEIALNRLNQLSQQRIQSISVFDTHYTLAAYLSHWQKLNDYGDRPLGNVEILFDSYKQRNVLNREYLLRQLRRLEARKWADDPEPLADQLLALFSNRKNRTMVNKLISQAVVDLNDPDSEAASEALLDKFLRSWDDLEDKTRKALRKLGHTFETRSAYLLLVEKDQVLSESFAITCNHIRHIRNQIVIDHLAPAPEELRQLVSDIDRMTKYLKHEYGV